MSPLLDSERVFLEQRRSQKHVGLYILPTILIVIGLVWAAMFFWWPLAINPNAVLGAAEMNIITCGSGALTRYALSATVLVNVLLLLLTVACVVGIFRAGRERRYQRIIERLAKEAGEPRLAPESRAVRQ